MAQLQSDFGMYCKDKNIDMCKELLKVMSNLAKI